MIKLHLDNKYSKQNYFQFTIKNMSLLYDGFTKNEGEAVNIM